jgi:signal transduction histidine kinase
LGRVISEGKPRLHPVDLIQSIDRAMILARRAYPNKEVDEKRDLPSDTKSTLTGINVLSDDLLDEVFLNLFSNAIKFTEGSKVAIDITVEEWPPKGVDRKERSSSVESKISNQIRAAIDRPSWRISVADHGPGIPDEQKLAIFDRYTSFWKGTGLGMSIVHALVVGRYDGEIVVRDNTQGLPDRGKGGGTTFVLSLLKA